MNFTDYVNRSFELVSELPQSSGNVAAICKM